jgi:hypothetical protein
MAIKYTQEETGRGRPPYSYDAPGLFGSARRVDLKRRLLFIYIGIGAIVCALSILNVRGRFDTFEKQPELRAAALITEKQDGAALVLQVEGLDATYTPDPEVFGRLKPGDRVAVLYQRSRFGLQIRILEVGVVPITDRP